jgi:hypothetical protein
LRREIVKTTDAANDENGLSEIRSAQAAEQPIAQFIPYNSGTKPDQ